MNDETAELNDRAIALLARIGELVQQESAQVAVAALAFASTYYATNVSPEFQIAMANQWNRAAMQGQQAAVMDREGTESSGTRTVH